MPELDACKNNNTRDELKIVAGTRNIAKTGIVTCAAGCALGTMGRVENNESLFFLIFGITPGTPIATENRRGAWQTMPLLLRQ